MAFQWPVFWEALTSLAFLRGAAVTVALALASHAVAIALSVPMALVAEGGSRAGRAAVLAYVWLFRGSPTLLQLLFVWNALPQFVPALRETWFTPFLAAWLALSLNEAAYQIEINRAALRAVDPGQIGAGRALGLHGAQVFRLVVLPQALRIAIPPTVNEFVNLLKVTSLASVISLRELLTVTAQTVAVSFRFTELYAVALVYYLIIVSVLMLAQTRIERRFDWGDRRAAIRPGGAGR